MAEHHNNPDLSAKELMAILEIDESVIQGVRRYGEIAKPRLTDFIEDFYLWLGGTPYFHEFFGDEHRLARVKSSQTKYWDTFFDCDLSERYLENRREIGVLHAHVGLPLTAYFAGMDRSLSLLLKEHYDGSMSEDEYRDCSLAVTRMCHFDTTVVVETYSKIVSQRIADQANSLLAMSTPVTLLWDGILLLPIVGIIDSKRAQEIMQSSLSKIAETRARVFIFDISGVSVVDTAVANHLIKVVRAAELMGCNCILSGLSPAIAQTIVELGIDVANVNTTSTMRNAVEQAFEIVGLSFSAD